MINLHDLTNNIIKSIEEGVENNSWTKPWRVIGGERPINAKTQKCYKGMNILILGFQADKMGYSSSYWAGLRQWNQLGAKVKKGEKHTKIVYGEMKTSEKEVDGETQEYSFFMRKTLRVFNADQIIGWNSPEVEELEITDDMYIAVCDEFAENTQITTKWVGQRACFIPSINEVHMPPRELFVSTKDGTAAYNIYSTLFHEFGHATGHESRLNRKFGKKFGDTQYAIEELGAELTSAFLCAQFGIADKTEPRQDHLKYLNSWVIMMKDQPAILLTCASQAQKAVDYLNETSETKSRQQAA